jgi:hypothetical protein
MEGWRWSVGDREGREERKGGEGGYGERLGWEVSWVCGRFDPEKVDGS